MLGNMDGAAELLCHHIADQQWCTRLEEIDLRDNEFSDKHRVLLEEAWSKAGRKQGGLVFQRDECATQ